MPRDLITNKQKILLAQASSPYKHALREVLSQPGIASRIKVRPGICNASLFILGTWD